MKKLITILMMAFAVVAISCGGDPEKGATGLTGPAGSTGSGGDKGDQGDQGDVGDDGKTIITGLQITAGLTVETKVLIASGVVLKDITYSTAGTAVTDPVGAAATVFVADKTVLDYQTALAAVLNELPIVKSGFMATVLPTDLVPTGTLPDAAIPTTVLTTIEDTKTLILTLKAKIGPKALLGGAAAVDKVYTYTQDDAT